MQNKLKEQFHIELNSKKPYLHVKILDDIVLFYDRYRFKFESLNKKNSNI